MSNQIEVRKLYEAHTNYDHILARHDDLTESDMIPTSYHTELGNYRLCVAFIKNHREEDHDENGWDYWAIVRYNTNGRPVNGRRKAKILQQGRLTVTDVIQYWDPDDMMKDIEDLYEQDRGLFLFELRNAIRPDERGYKIQKIRTNSITFQNHNHYGKFCVHFTLD